MLYTLSNYNKILFFLINDPINQVNGMEPLINERNCRVNTGKKAFLRPPGGV